MSRDIFTKIAIVYDWIDKWGGVERVLLVLHELFPQAEFYTSYYGSEKAGWAKDLKIKTSFIQKLPTFIRRSRLASFPFYPFAFESYDFSGFDLVISVTSSFAKSIVTKPGTLHICYLLTPTRYLWFLQEDYFKNRTVKFLLAPYLANLREWDYLASQRPDHIISISQTVANRCRKYYRRDSEVVYPPFDIEYWEKIKKNVILGTPPLAGDSRIDSGQVFRQAQDTEQSRSARMTVKKLKGKKFFLVVSRLESYKRIDLVIKTFNNSSIGASLRRPSQRHTIDELTNLVIVGEGSEELNLKKIAGKNIQFFCRLTDAELSFIYNNAEALIMPQEEDFGYVSLEAQFFGCPVIAYQRGGATETVIEGKTGIFFNKQSIESISSALKRYGMVKYRLKRSTQELGQKNVEKFAKDKFVEEFKAFIISKIK